MTMLSMKFVFGLVIFLLGVYKAISYDIDENQVLEELLSPQQNPSIQIRALRRELLKRVQDAINKLDSEENYQTLERWENLPYKRNLEALARAGYIKTLPEEEEEDDANYKRSIANLAKNGELPRRQEEQKRGLESLARSGDLRSKNIQSLLENLNDKRHISSVLKGYNLPTVGKKSLSSLAKSGDLNNYKHVQYKRSAQDGTGGGSDNRLPNTISKQFSGKEKLLLNDKSIIDKRGKRNADYYYEKDENYSPFYQNNNNNNNDYDDLIEDLHAAYPEVDKRFLGSVMRSGFRPSTINNAHYLNPEKRHIGALARLGWLPSFRHIRRFNRSGRSGTSDICRASTSNGKTEINSYTEDAPLLLKSNNNYSYKIPGKTIFLKRVFYHPNVSKYF